MRSPFVGGNAFSRMSNGRKALVLFVVGGVFLLVGLFTFLGNLSFQYAAAASTGTVMSVQRVNSLRTTDVITVVRYTDSHGGTHEVTTHNSSDEAWAPGDHVVVHYDPQNPNDIRLGGATDSFVLPLVFAAFGLVIVVGGGYFWRRRNGRGVLLGRNSE